MSLKIFKTRAVSLFATFVASAAALPQISSPSQTLSFTPLPSSFTNPTNLTLLYTDAKQVPKPDNVFAQGIDISSDPVIINSTLSELDAAIAERAACGGPVSSNPTKFWREAMTHNGIAPLISDTTYLVWRTAVQWGADNTGVNDASGAINEAIIAWSRRGNGVTTRPAYIYVPAGTYRISHSINMIVNTFLVGDPLNPPTFVADASLGTNPVIYAYDNTQGDGSATKNFYMAVRNINIDTRAISTGTRAVGLNWAVSQGCSLYNVQFIMPNYSSHIGITMESDSGGGSGTIISDCSFQGGAIGILMSNQQYNLKGLSFNGCNVGIYIGSIFVGTFQGLTFQNCNYGLDMSNSGSVGGISLIDSSVSSCNAGVYTAVTGYGEGSLIIDNFAVGAGTRGVLSTAGNVLVPGSVPAGSTWVMGNENPQNYQSGKIYPINRPAALLQNGKYFAMKQPQYENYDASQFVNVKSVAGFPVYGDNQHDDGPAINAILAANANCKIIYFPQGIYKTQSTIYVPPGSRLVGEVFSVITGIGSNFWNPDLPQPVVKVGNAGEVGVAQFTDLIFTVADVLQGAIILQVNMAGSSPGDVGFWNTGIRVGGSADSLVNSNCGNTNTAYCKAAFAMLHVTSTASPYIENMWGWTADHSLDGGPAQNIAVGRGALIESTKGTWLVGTSFEHNVMYQYHLNKAQNVYIGMQQTENPYWQGIGNDQWAPGPWTALTAYGDPTFSNCAAQGQSSNQLCYRAWGHHMSSSSNIVIHGSALWVFFNNMNNNQWTDAGCANVGGVCQYNMAFVSGASGTFWYNAQSKSSTNIIYDTTGGVNVASANNNPGSWGAVIAAYLRDSGVPGALK